MSGLRTCKSKLCSAIYETRDTLVSGIDRSLDGKDAMALCQKMTDLFMEFHNTCTDLHREWDVFKEIDKQARLNAEHNHARADVQEASTMVSEYLESFKNAQFRPQAQELKKTKSVTKEVTRLTSPEKEALNQEIDKVMYELETFLADVKLQQSDIYSKLGASKIPFSDIPVASERVQPSGDEYKEKIPTTDKRLHFEQEKRFSPLRFSMPKMALPGNQPLLPTYRSCTAGKHEQDPFRGLQRLSIPKFKGDKQSFEAWYAGSYQTVGRHDKVPPVQKLLRLHSHLEGEALRTIQNLGYSAAAYDVAIAILEGKYGGKR